MKRDIIDRIDEIDFGKGPRKLKQAIQTAQAKKYIKKARSKSDERRRVWDEYTGLFELMDRFSRTVKAGANQAKKTPGYNIDNLLDTWDATIKDFKKRLKQTDKKVL